MPREFSFERILDEDRGYVSQAVRLVMASEGIDGAVRTASDFLNDRLDHLGDEFMSSYYRLSPDEVHSAIYDTIMTYEDDPAYNIAEVMDLSDQYDGDFIKVNMYGAGDALEEAREIIVAGFSFDVESAVATIEADIEALEFDVPEDDLYVFDLLPLVRESSRVYQNIDADISEYERAVRSGDTDTAVYLFENVFAPLLDGNLRSAASSAVSEAFIVLSNSMCSLFDETESRMVSRPGSYWFEYDSTGYLCYLGD